MPVALTALLARLGLRAMPVVSLLVLLVLCVTFELVDPSGDTLTEVPEVVGMVLVATPRDGLLAPTAVMVFFVVLVLAVPLQLVDPARDTLAEGLGLVGMAIATPLHGLLAPAVVMLLRVGCG